MIKYIKILILLGVILFTSIGSSYADLSENDKKLLDFVVEKIQDRYSEKKVINFLVKLKVARIQLKKDIQKYERVSYVISGLEKNTLGTSDFTQDTSIITTSNNTPNNTIQTSSSFCPKSIQNLVYKIPTDDMYNGASYEGEGECIYSGEIKISEGTKINASTIKNNCAYHGGTLHYTSGPRKGESEKCMCTIFVSCSSSGVFSVGHTW